VFLGRSQLVKNIAREALQGETLLLRGPWGIGKTAVLTHVARSVREAGRACGVAQRTEVLRDVIAALEACYPEARGSTYRETRIRIRRATDRRPGVLLLDHLGQSTPPLRTYLKALRGTGVGVIIAADVEHARDRESVRALRLAYRELDIPPLGRPDMGHVLSAELARKDSPRPLDEAERRRLLALADGRPGLIRWLLDFLTTRGAGWPSGRIHWETLRAEMSAAVVAIHLHRSMASGERGRLGWPSRASASGSAST